MLVSNTSYSSFRADRKRLIPTSSPCPPLNAPSRREAMSSLLNEMREISSMIDTTFVYQDEQLGLGHAVLMAKDEIGDEPFAVFLPRRHHLLGHARHRRDD